MEQNRRCSVQRRMAAACAVHPPRAWTLHKDLGRVYDGAILMVLHLLLESRDGAALCTQNAGGTFPLLLPILGSGNLHTWGQIIIRYSSHTCIAQDLGSSPWLLKRFRAQCCSHCMHELSLYWEQAELSSAHFSLTYSCNIKEINFFKILVKNHTHLSSFIWWFNYLRCQGLNELLKNEVILFTITTLKLNGPHALSFWHLVFIHT